MNYIVLAYILYFAGCLEFLGSTLLLYFMHFSCIILGLWGFYKCMLTSRWNALTVFILLYCFVFPLYGSISSRLIFGQPFITGLLSFRYNLFILFGFFLFYYKVDYRTVIRQLNAVNLFIAIAAIIAFFVFDIDHIVVKQYVTSTRTIDASSAEDTIKGAKLTVCSTFMVISYVYYLIKVLDNPFDRKYLIIFGIFMFYLLFVHKGRIPVAALGVVYYAYTFRMKGSIRKKLTYIFAPFVLVIAMLMTKHSIADSFISAVQGDDSLDSSTLTRVNSIDEVLSFVKPYFALGMGNLSVRFGDNGFQAYFGDSFYIADIGIIGAWARGGVLLILIYLGIYILIWKMSRFKYADKELTRFHRYILVAFAASSTIFMSDQLYDGGFNFALLFYPYFTGGVMYRLYFLHDRNLKIK